MSLDWELMIFAAGAQLIMAVMGTWWALRPPNPKWHRAIIAAYAVVGLCGIAAIGYSTYRANISEERKEPHPRLVISKFQVVPIPTPDKTGDVGIRLYMVNRGDRFGYSPKITSGIKIGAPLTTAQVEHEMAKLIKIAEKSAPSRVDEIEVGEETFRPMQRIRNVDWQAVVSGKKTLYVFAVLAFTDDTLPTNEFWVSEFGAVQSESADVYMIFRQKTSLYVRPH